MPSSHQILGSRMIIMLYGADAGVEAKECIKIFLGMVKVCLVINYLGFFPIIMLLGSSRLDSIQLIAMSLDY